VLLIDSLIAGGIRFVLGKIVAAVDAELNDDSRLREELLAAQMRLEVGELSQEEFDVFEAGILARLREIRERQIGLAPSPGEMRVTGVEATAYSEQE
jgi:hypothetical protein